MFKKRRRKRCMGEMGLEAINQYRQFRFRMIVTNRSPRRLPHLLLWVQIRRCDWQRHDFQARIRCQDIADGLSAMPRRPIPQQQNRPCRMRGQDLRQMPRRGLSIHCRGLRGEHLSGS